MPGKLSVLLVSAILVAFTAGQARADSADSVAVSDVTDASSPIGITQSGFFPSSDASHQLWIAYSNRSNSLIARFELRGSWVDAAGTQRAYFSTIVSFVIGPGERTTATIPGLTQGPAGTKLRISVARVRFNDLALWAAPPPPAAVAATTASQPAGSTPTGEVARSPKNVTVPAGTPLDIRVAAYADSSTARNGDAVPFVVERDVVVDGVTVIPRDAIGWGHLESVGRASNWGRSGSLHLVVDSVPAVDGSTIYLDGGLRVAPPRVRPKGLAALFGMFSNGKEAELVLGAPASVTSVRDVSVNVSPIPATAIAR